MRYANLNRFYRLCGPRSSYAALPGACLWAPGSPGYHRSSSKTTRRMQVTWSGAWPAEMLGLHAIMGSTCCDFLHSIDCVIPLYLLYCICDNNSHRLFVRSCYIPRLSKDNPLSRVWITFASSWKYSFSLIIFWLAREHSLVLCSIGRGIYAGLTSDTISFGVETLRKYLATIIANWRIGGTRCKIRHSKVE
jgi:hypothetical protein